jgi:hypothetical protein
VTESGHDVPLSRKERELVALVAKANGITEEEAVTLLVKAALARICKKRTGKMPAKVYALPKK